jgi:chemotaxis protein methyltransferase CheR
MSINFPTPPSPNVEGKPAQLSSEPTAAPLFGMREVLKITRSEIELFSKYIHSISGINIDATKSYLLETRLAKIVEAHKCANYSELYNRAKADQSKVIENKIIDAITTNETLFFRDNSPFDLLRHKILPELIDKSSNISSSGISRGIRIWSAACSTGQEVYSITIVLKELLGDVNRYSIQLLGTDLSDAAIKQASYGMYNKFEIDRGLAKERMQRYFTVNGGNYKVCDELRAMATFKKINLMQPFQGIGKFDVILCRNVAIYFTLEDRKKLFNKIAERLEPDGFLIIGSTESLTGVCPQFVPKRHLNSIFYQLK